MVNHPGIKSISVTSAGGPVKFSATDLIANCVLHVPASGGDVKLRIDGGTYVALYAGNAYSWVNVNLSRFELATDQVGAQTAILTTEAPGR